MKSKVWFTPVSQGESPGSVGEKVLRLVEKAGLKEVVRKDGLIGILQHVGEGANIGYIKPEVTRALADRISKMGGKPFLTGSSTLYKGRRHNAVDHLTQAYEHGFTPEKIGCPVVMCDGLRGSDRVSVEVPKAKHCHLAYLGSGVALMEGLVVVTHPTGHIATGFGAAMKNVGMGLANRGGKLAMHHGNRPKFLARKCKACGRCVQWCPEDAIEMEEIAKLIPNKCVGCGECYSVCPHDAIDFEWTTDGQDLQERVVEYCVAAHAQLKGRLVYVNVAQHFQEGCDCFDTRQEAVCPDLGILASRDLVAVDAATADLLARANGRDVVREAAGRDYRKMLEYGQRMGLGGCEYELVEC